MNVLCFSFKSKNIGVSSKSKKDNSTGKKKRDNRTNNDLQKQTTEKTQDWETRTFWLLNVILLEYNNNSFVIP
jgi:hypothetical protein